MGIFEEILKKRGLDDPAKRDAFLNPSYDAKHDPFLLPDMAAAVERLVVARQKQEHITIYGDYDIDGLTATTILLDAFASFGFEHVDAFIPNRFVEGYGLTVDAIERIASPPAGGGATLVVTVDCGSLSHEPIARAKELGVDVIVTDHHNVAKEQPPAVAVINPKRLLQDFPEAYEGYILKSDFDVSLSNAATVRQDDFSDKSLSAAQLAGAQTDSPRQDSSLKSSGQRRASSKDTSKSSPAAAVFPSTTSHLPSPNLYPFLDLAGCGVAFKLMQALQTRLDGLKEGQEKWLLDLVALGTVCDVVTLVDENRANVYWGLKVLAKTRRPGLKALMAVSRIDPKQLTTRSLGFGLGPRMNAAGRLETAQIALDMLRATDNETAYEKASELDALNTARRSEQDKIYKEAIKQAQKYEKDNVLVVSDPKWNHGIIGIVAAKLLEKYKKPTYVLQEMGEESKGSARSYGGFSAADAIRAADDIITKGGGHKLAAGVTLPTANIQAFRERVNKFYAECGLNHATEAQRLLPEADAVAEIDGVSEELIEKIAALEPFGSGNPQPILQARNLTVLHVRRMGAEGQHVKLELQQPDTAPSAKGSHPLAMQFLAFNAPEHFFVDIGMIVDVWFQPDVNEWQGRRSVEGRLLHLVVGSPDE